MLRISNPVLIHSNGHLIQSDFFFFFFFFCLSQPRGLEPQQFCEKKHLTCYSDALLECRAAKTLRKNERKRSDEQFAELDTSGCEVLGILQAQVQADRKASKNDKRAPGKGYDPRSI